MTVTVLLTRTVHLQQLISVTSLNDYRVVEDAAGNLDSETAAKSNGTVAVSNSFILAFKTDLLKYEVHLVLVRALKHPRSVMMTT